MRSEQGGETAMSNDEHTIKVSLDTSAHPPVSVHPSDVDLKNKGTHKVVWNPADGTAEFTFYSLRIDGTTYPNPTAGGSPGKNSPLSDINVSDKKITLKDKVDGRIDFPYELVVLSGGKTYSSGEVRPSADGGTPRIRNQP
jgi:hypothetical protein